jgi:hypothetical protein
MAALGGIACASTPDEESVGATPEFARPQGAWTAEELHRDLIHCLDEVHAELLAELGDSRAAGPRVRREMRDRTSECMAAAGWVGREAPQG